LNRRQYLFRSAIFGMPSSFGLLRLPDYRRLFAAVAFSTSAGRALVVVLGYEVYALTHNPLALGGMGLAALLPAAFGALYAGYVADRRDRRAVLQVIFVLLTVCAAALALLKVFYTGPGQIALLYAVVFVVAIAKGFVEPTASALEAQLVPKKQLVHAATLTATCWLVGAVVGPLVGGATFAAFGSVGSYAVIGGMCAAAAVAVTRITFRRKPRAPRGVSPWKSVVVGIRYVVHRQELFGSMTLDLFAILFAGAIALLPVFASDILHVGPTGLGILSATPTTGALFAILWSTWLPPVRNAGRNLFLAVAGFGATMIAFALSESFYFSVAALFFSGVCDGISEVIRRSILRVLSPNRLRGRTAAVSTIFGRLSTELGILVSGVAAALLGTARAVWIGGVVTLVVVAITIVVFPKLRRLHINPEQATAANSG
jgi:MFS family permease